MRCSPQHYDIGWHITGTTGVFGAAAAIGKLLRLDAQRLSWAFGLAATQPVGPARNVRDHDEEFPSRPGRAKRFCRGAARRQRAIPALNRRSRPSAAGPTSSAPRTTSTKLPKDWASATKSSPTPTSRSPAASSSIRRSTVACRSATPKILIPPKIRKVDLRVHHLVLELTGKTAPKTGLEGKFSVYHAAAMAFIEGDGGEAQFSDRAVDRSRGYFPARPHQGRNRPHDRAGRGAHHGARCQDGRVDRASRSPTPSAASPGR